MDPRDMAELRRFIKKEIHLQMNTITAGQCDGSTMTTEDIANIYPGHPTIPGRPIMRPYGFASRAPKGTLAVTAQQGSHPGNKLTLGHRDANPPAVDEGESVQYSLGGYRIVCKNGEMFVGKGADLEHVVVGETLKTAIIAILDAIVAHEHIGNLGFQTSPPINASDFTDIKTGFFANDKILAKNGGRY